MVRRPGRRGVVRAEQSAKYLATPDRGSGQGDDLRVVVGDSKAMASVGPSRVVVLRILVEDRTQVAFTGDQESVGALCAG
ncbi:hypothetical protein GCM10009577_52110 [Streptomyces javensis]